MKRPYIADKALSYLDKIIIRELNKITQEMDKKMYSDDYKKNSYTDDGYVPKSEDHRVRVYATDNEGNPGWRDIIAEFLKYADDNENMQDTPVGHIIALMDTDVPKHYLKCDGTEYHIGDWPYLEDHITRKFGTVNHFGGDGETTWKVPDLRGEFLRGTGTADRNTGTGAAIGEHQNGTEIPSTFVLSSNKVVQFRVANESTNTNPKGTDVELRDGLYYANSSATIGTTGNGSYTRYTSRPTNTAVLYCIKCEPTYYVAISGNPVGTVISFMGTEAPDEYLKCDGSVYNIDEYPKLAQHIYDQFETYQYWGGSKEDNTFAVPDLRGEFLRGNGTAKRNTGSGAAVGTHQNPTYIPNVLSGSNRLSVYTTISPSNMDNQTANQTLKYVTASSNTSNTYPTSYTTRPTNTAVLYCIKYK